MNHPHLVCPDRGPNVCPVSVRLTPRKQRGDAAITQTEKSNREIICNGTAQSGPVFCLGEEASAVARQMFGLDRCVVERHPSIWLRTPSITKIEHWESEEHKSPFNRKSVIEECRSCTCKSFLLWVHQQREEEEGRKKKELSNNHLRNLILPGLNHLECLHCTSETDSVPAQRFHYKRVQMKPESEAGMKNLTCQLKQKYNNKHCARSVN